MILKVTSTENLEAGNFVLLLFSDSEVRCRRCFGSEPPDAIARRDIAAGETIVFDSGQDTDDLLRPGSHAYDPEFR